MHSTCFELLNSLLTVLSHPFFLHLNQRQKKSHRINISYISLKHRHHQYASLLITGSHEQNSSLQVHLLKWHQHKIKIYHIYFRNTHSLFNCARLDAAWFLFYIIAFKTTLVFTQHHQSVFCLSLHCGALFTFPMD